MDDAPDVLDVAFRAAAEKLSRINLHGPENNWERCLVAALIAASAAADRFLALDPDSEAEWAYAGVEEGEQLLEVWASTLAAFMLRTWQDPSVVTEVARQYSDLFGTNSQVAEGELRVYELQRVHDEGESRPALAASSLLVLRCRRAVGLDVPDLTNLPVPVRESRELIDAGLVLPDPLVTLGVEGVQSEALRNARDVSDRLDAT